MVGEGEARRALELARVLVSGNLHSVIIRRPDVVIPVVDRLEREEFRRELIRIQDEGGVRVEDVRIACVVFRFQVEVVVVVADEVCWSCWIHDRHAEFLLTLTDIQKRIETSCKCLSLRYEYKLVHGASAVLLIRWKS